MTLFGINYFLVPSFLLEFISVFICMVFDTANTYDSTFD